MGGGPKIQKESDVANAAERGRRIQKAVPASHSDANGMFELEKYGATRRCRFYMTIHTLVH